MGSEARFAAYVEQLGTALGHADRREPLHDYCLGLLMPIERKSVEPMAALLKYTAQWNREGMLLYAGTFLGAWDGRRVGGPLTEGGVMGALA
jgi:hypothetical protein